MAKDEKKKPRNNKEEVRSLISKETSNAILSVFSFVAAIFLLLGAFGFAGKAGTFVYETLSEYLFGLGYYILPIVFILIAVSLIRDRERAFGKPQLLGSIILFLPTLGFVNLLSSRGGRVGNLISSPLVSFFDIYVSAIVLIALSLASLLIIFNTPIKLEKISSIFSKKTEEAPATGALADAETAAIDKAVEAANSAEKGQTLSTDSQGLTLRSGTKTTKDEGFVPVITRRSGKPWTPPPVNLLEGDK